MGEKNKRKRKEICKLVHLSSLLMCQYLMLVLDACRQRKISQSYVCEIFIGGDYDHPFERIDFDYFATTTSLSL